MFSQIKIILPLKIFLDKILQVKKKTTFYFLEFHFFAMNT